MEGGKKGCNEGSEETCVDTEGWMKDRKKERKRERKKIKEKFTLEEKSWR